MTGTTRHFPSDVRGRESLIHKMVNAMRARLKEDRRRWKKNRLGFDKIFDELTQEFKFDSNDDRSWFKSEVSKRLGLLKELKYGEAPPIYLSELEARWAEADKAAGHTANDSRVLEALRMERQRGGDPKED